MDEDRNARIERRCDSTAKLCESIEAAAKLGFRDVTVTTLKQDVGVVYVLDLAERCETARVQVVS